MVQAKKIIYAKVLWQEGARTRGYALKWLKYKKQGE